MKKIKIGKKLIGEDSPCFIIAEAGLNHNGNLKIAKKLINEAVKAGADAIKFQTYKTEGFVRKKDKNFNLFKSLELKNKEWAELSKFAKESKIIFFSSVFDQESVDLLDKLNVVAYKIASGDLTHLPLLAHIAQKKKPIILSTGMGIMAEINEALKIIYSQNNKNVALLHCVSSYPAKYEELNLKVINTMRKKFKIPIGFSDHTKGIIAPLSAVALGANIIEKHFTLNKNLPGPDHKFSLNTAEFREMVENIRMIEKMLGNGVKKPVKSELGAKKRSRRSVVANVKIPKGVRITRAMLKIVIPGTGIEPKFVNKIIGKITKKNIQEDEMINQNKIL